MRKSAAAKKARGSSEEFVLQLFVFGSAPTSLKARRTLELIRDEYLRGRCAAAVIDVAENPQAAAVHEILATPTLLVTRGEETQRIVGSLDDPARVLTALGILSVAGQSGEGTDSK